MHDAASVEPVTTSTPSIPDYLAETYWWAYLHPRSIWFFEQQWIIDLILWGNYARLRDSALQELGSKVNGRILQVACVYGNFTSSLATRLAPDARLDVIDVAPGQLENLKRKLGPHPQVHLDCQNAAHLNFTDASFDQVIVFFLLHEMPKSVRLKVIHEVLRVIKPRGKVVFVDYHKPCWWHPHRYLMIPILRGLEPYAMDLWNEEIPDWIELEQRPLHLTKDTYFSGLYQKIVIIR